MKKLILIAFAFLTSLHVVAQDSGDAFLGHWTNPENNTALVVYKDVYDHYKAISWSLENGEVITVTDVTIAGDVMTLVAYIPSAKTTLRSKFYKQGDDDMEEIIDMAAGSPDVRDWIRETP